MQGAFRWGGIALFCLAGCAAAPLSEAPSPWLEAQSSWANGKPAAALFDWTALQGRAPRGQEVQAVYHLARVLDRLDLEEDAYALVRHAAGRVTYDSARWLLELAKLELDFSERTLALLPEGKPLPLAGTPYAENVAYMAGFLRGNDSLLRRVPQGHADYLYARFTLGIMHAQKEVGESVLGRQFFIEVVTQAPRDVGEALLSKAAMVRLGHLEFGNGNLEAAANAYRKVIRSSMRSGQYMVESDEVAQAWLGLGWCFLKAHPDAARSVAGSLRDIWTEEPLHSEALYLEGLALFRMRDLQGAIGPLERIVALWDARSLANAQATEMRLQALKKRWEHNKQQLRLAYTDAWQRTRSLEEGGMDQVRRQWLQKWRFAFDERTHLLREWTREENLQRYKRLLKNLRDDAEYLRATINMGLHPRDSGSATDELF